MHKYSLMLPLLGVALVCALSACGYTSNTSAGAIGGVTGGAVGAGTGALVGSLIKDGDVPRSTLLGGAAGIPIGIVLGVAWNNYQYNKIVNRNEEIIQANRDRIGTAQGEIDTLRERLTAESSRIQPDTGRSGYLYDGPRLGQYRR